MSERPANWLALLYAYLAEQATTAEALATLRTLRIFPLANGDLAALNEAPIFLPEKRRKRYEFESHLRVLRPDILPPDKDEAASLVEKLIRLGLQPHQHPPRLTFPQMT